MLKLFPRGDDTDYISLYIENRTVRKLAAQISSVFKALSPRIEMPPSWCSDRVSLEAFCLRSAFSDPLDLVLLCVYL